VPLAKALQTALLLAWMLGDPRPRSRMRIAPFHSGAV
jgi:hypothetical protein